MNSVAILLLIILIVGTATAFPPTYTRKSFFRKRFGFLPCLSKATSTDVLTDLKNFLTSNFTTGIKIRLYKLTVPFIQNLLLSYIS